MRQAARATHTATESAAASMDSGEYDSGDPICLNGISVPNYAPERARQASAVQAYFWYANRSLNPKRAVRAQRSVEPLGRSEERPNS